MAGGYTDRDLGDQFLAVVRDEVLALRRGDHVLPAPRFDREIEEEDHQLVVVVLDPELLAPPVRGDREELDRHGRFGPQEEEVAEFAAAEIGHAKELRLKQELYWGHGRLLFLVL